MIKLVTIGDIDKVKHLPVEVIDSIKEVLDVFDEAYGSDRREIDLGGLVVTIESELDLKVMKDSVFLDVWEEQPEWEKIIMTVGNKEWYQFLFVMSSDYSIVLVGEKDKLGFIKGE